MSDRLGDASRRELAIWISFDEPFPWSSGRFVPMPQSHRAFQFLLPFTSWLDRESFHLQSSPRASQLAPGFAVIRINAVLSSLNF